MRTSLRLVGAVALSLLGLGLATRSAHAQVAIDFTGGTTSFSGGAVTWGYQFTTTQAFTLTDLAFFDLGSDGLASAHDIGLWDSTTALIASATVPAGTGAPTLPSTGGGSWRTVGVAPLALAPGSYVIGATFPSSSDQSVFLTASVSSIPGVTFGTSRFTIGSGLNYPSNSLGSDRDPGYFGPGFVVTGAAAAVPEPGEWAVLATGALSVGGLMLKARKKASAWFRDLGIPT